jgi:Ser/Thr protein kinase RdoA (MazF antagonist)/transposase
MHMVTAYLVSCGLQVPSLVSTLDGKPFARDMSGGRWRVYPWLPGHVVESLPDPVMAREAGRLVGLLHKYLAACDYLPQGSIPHFHDTDFVLTELQNVHPQLPDEMRSIADGILATLPSLIVTDEPQQLIHGDLKISNLIFDDLGHAVGIIDFDTILRHARVIDLGDAFRSWCNRTAEDDPDARFDIVFFEAAASGYAEGFGMPSGPQERTRHLRAAKQITLELAARFLIDVVHDAYFGFDAARYPHRRAHNVARAWPVSSGADNSLPLSSLPGWSGDLRHKIVHAHARRLGSQRALAELFGVSVSFVEKLLHRHWSTWDVAPKPPAGGQQRRLEATAEVVIQEAVRATPDITLQELCARVADTQGLRVSIPMMCRALQRSGLPRKKVAPRE